MRRRRAYIARPRDKGKYKEAERFLVTMDFLVVNPMKYEEDFSPRDIREKEYVDDVCLTGLQLCDVIFMLEGWEEEKEAVLELETAKHYNRINGTGIGVAYQEFTK